MLQSESTLLCLGGQLSQPPRFAYGYLNCLVEDRGGKVLLLLNHPPFADLPASDFAPSSCKGLLRLVTLSVSYTHHLTRHPLAGLAHPPPRMM